MKTKDLKFVVVIRFVEDMCQIGIEKSTDLYYINSFLSRRIDRDLIPGIMSFNDRVVICENKVDAVNFANCKRTNWITETTRKLEKLNQMVIAGV